MQYTHVLVCIVTLQCYMVVGSVQICPFLGMVYGKWCLLGNNTVHVDLFGVYVDMPLIFGMQIVFNTVLQFLCIVVQ